MLHVVAVNLLLLLSIAWLRQQKILESAPFDRSSVITYSPEEYLPPLDTGTVEAPKPQKGDPVFARQPILSVPREADNHSQTIVAPPNLKLDHDVPLPNIVATGAVAPVVPLNAISLSSSRAQAPEQQVVAPAPELDFPRDRVTQAALKSDIVPPPPEVTHGRAPGPAGPETAVIAPPPELTTPAKGRAGQINIAPSTAVAPAPQLAMAEQHALYARGQGGGRDSLPESAQPVAPPPSVAGNAGSGGGQGRLIALNIHPVTPAGPVVVPGGNRRGSFEAGPRGKSDAPGTPDVVGSNSAANGSGQKGRSGSYRQGFTLAPVRDRLMRLPGMARLEMAIRVKWHRRWPHL